MRCRDAGHHAGVASAQGAARQGEDVAVALALRLAVPLQQRRVSGVVAHVHDGLGVGVEHRPGLGVEQGEGERDGDAADPVAAGQDDQIDAPVVERFLPEGQGAAGQTGEGLVGDLTVGFEALERQRAAIAEDFE